MKKILIHMTIAAILLAAGLVGITQRAAADQAYHTERLVLEPVDDAPLLEGFVVNIHPNGPINFAHEIYQLNGASPLMSYQVYLYAYPKDSNCNVEPVMKIPTAELVTNKLGKGKAEKWFTPEDVTDLHGFVLDLKWQVMIGDTLHYQTQCTQVTLD
jgi:hypothetical protein